MKPHQSVGFFVIFIEMGISKELSLIRAKIFLNENMYLKRRVTWEELVSAFEEALSWTTQRFKKTETTLTLKQFINSVIATTIDEIHPKLIEEPGEDLVFPYKDISMYISDLFMDRIKMEFEKEFN